MIKFIIYTIISIIVIICEYVVLIIGGNKTQALYAKKMVTNLLKNYTLNIV